MSTVAIAGGTGKIGHVITDALKESPKHKVIILARKVRQVAEDQDLGVPVFTVDYDDIEAVVKILESNNVHTVISTISVIAAEAGASEVKLVKAAAQSVPTKRFIASDWGVATPPTKHLQLPQHEFRLATIDALRKTNLEWTRVYNGFLLDYYGIPHIQTYMTPVVFVVDMLNKMAAIPGTGNEPMTFTYTRDVATFTVAALELPNWDEITYCYGDKTTWNNFLSVAEEMTGSKFNVTYDPVEKLERGEVTELPSHPLGYDYFPKLALQAYFSKFGLYIINGIFDLPEDKSLNKKFPEIKTMTVKEMLSVWKGK